MRQQDRVIAESGQLVEADYCIVTIPIACLKDCCVVTSPELVISSRLSPKKEESIDTLHRWGWYMKVYLVFGGGFLVDGTYIVWVGEE